MRVRNLTDNDLERLRLGRRTLFICSASFEERCLTTPRKISRQFRGQAIVFCNSEVGELGEKNLMEIKALFGSCIEVARISGVDQYFTFLAISSALNGDFLGKFEKVVVDITCFTRETLLVITRIFSYRLAMSTSIIILYNRANDYGGMSNGRGVKWLSRGVSSIRTVIGFSGSFISRRPVHLIVFAGFELDRLETIFEHTMPSAVTVCKSRGALEEPRKVALFRERLIVDAGRRYGEVAEVLFNPYSISDVMSTLVGVSEVRPGFSTIVAPLSTKVSTLAVGLVATFREDIQVIYVKPTLYNKKDYASPSGRVDLFQFSLLDLESKYTAI